HSSVTSCPTRRSSDLLVGEARCAHRDLEAPAAAAPGAGAGERVRLAILQPVELGNELVGREGEAGVEFERRRVHLGGQGPAPALDRKSTRLNSSHVKS